MSAAWVHYKLDRGIHHVLIDEAQDTSPKQWAIITALVSEFFAGRGAHDRPRTVFAVGDEKQSIFSFQGAVPREFAKNRDHFARAHRDAEMKFVFAQFKHSFRSGPNVLEAVDTVFKPRSRPRRPHRRWRMRRCTKRCPARRRAWSKSGIWRSRTRSRPRKAGPRRSTPRPSPAARSGSRGGSPARLRSGARRGGSPRDVLILVRRRGALFEAIIRALKNHGIPVAGADRLMLTEHIAVMDLMTLADALLLPEDDLALATVLKSPLFGLDDDASVQARLEPERQPACGAARAAAGCRRRAGTHRRCGAQADAVHLLCRTARRARRSPEDSRAARA